MESLSGARTGAVIPSTSEDDTALISRYQELVRHSADAITLVDASGVIQFESPSVERMLGYTQDELVGESLFDYVHPDDSPAIQAAIAEARASPEGSVHEAEYRFRHADGSWVWLSSVATVRPGGDDGGFVVSSRDVTERHEMQATLEAERALYEAVVAGVNDAIAIVRDGEIVFANPQCHELLDLEDGELVGRSFETVVAPADRELVVERYFQRLDPYAPDPPSRYEARFLTDRGNPIIGEINAERMAYEGRPAVLVAIRDVTKRAHYEEALEARNEELEALNQVVRHDIRNDMAVILGWAELLEDHVDDEGREYLTRVLDSAEHVVELTDVARDFVEMLTTGEGTELRAVPLRTTLRTELALRRESYPDARFVIDGELPAVSVTANEMLASVFTNVLTNAVQHHPDGAPEVRLSAAVEDGMAEVRVADDGPGIPDEAKEQVFVKGEKGDNSEGTGIGLYLVRTLVEQYGGSVQVEDNEPTGAVFVVRLPLAD